jgi:hypothetical protein
MTKKKILLLAYNFPPFIRASSMRTWGWFENFSSDVDVTVITRNWKQDEIYTTTNYFQEDDSQKIKEDYASGKVIIRIPNKYNFYFRIKNNSVLLKLKLNKLFTFFEMIVKWLPLVYFDNERSLYKEAKEILKTEKFDWVIASGEPFILFKYAILLKKEFGIKTCLDYRDGFSTNMFRNMSPNLIERTILNRDRGFEKKFLQSTDLVSFVSNKLRDEVHSSVLNFSSEKVVIINNGFDQEVTKVDSLSSSFEIDKNYFNLMFVGTLYEGHKIDILLSACNDLILKKRFNIKLVFVGSLISCPNWHKKLLLDFQEKLPENIQFIDYVKNSEAKFLQTQASVLLKFNAFEQHEGHFGKKLYEYAYSGKKVISINFSSSFKNILNFFDDRPFVYYCNDSEDIKRRISEFYILWMEKKEITNGISPNELNEFSTLFQTKKLEQKLLNL